MGTLRVTGIVTTCGCTDFGNCIILGGTSYNLPNCRLLLCLQGPWEDWMSYYIQGYWNCALWRISTDNFDRIGLDSKNYWFQINIVMNNKKINLESVLCFPQSKWIDSVSNYYILPLKKLENLLVIQDGHTFPPLRGA